MSDDEAPIRPDRRRFLIGTGLAAGAMGLGLEATAETPRDAEGAWDHDADVVCVGSGAAAATAAVTAAAEGARVVVVEKMPFLGGTTARSGGVTWIPNNAELRRQGIDDRKDDALRYLARFAFPMEYLASSPTLGLEEADYRRLEAFYDFGPPMVERLDALGAVRFTQFRMWQADELPPDYADHLPENKVPRGRGLVPATENDGQGNGAILTMQLERWLRAHDVPLLTDHRVTRTLRDGDRVVGVEAEHEGRVVRIRARRGVVFGTGGYAHAPTLIRRHQPAIYAACASPAATGDFLAIAEDAGAMMGNLGTAWRTQVVMQEALADRVIATSAFVLPGDAMIMVDATGQRVVNEKINYNDRTEVHFRYDPVAKRYPNQLLFMVFDGRTLDAFGGAYPLPLDPSGTPALVRGENFEALAANLSAELERMAAATGGFALAPDFAKGLERTVERFDTYARQGEDPEFGRGRYDYDVVWQRFFSPMRANTAEPVNPHPNPTMHPFRREGPYYAFILGPGALDTSGGPVIDARARVLGHDGRAIPGLFGAGNCVACPSREAYYAGGGTIGMAMTFGYLAGLGAAGVDPGGNPDPA